CAVPHSRATWPYASFLFPDPAPPEICTLSLHDALPILGLLHVDEQARLEVALIRQANANATARGRPPRVVGFADLAVDAILGERSEEHTSELQSRGHLVCRLLLEKKNQTGLGSVPRRSR